MSAQRAFILFTFFSVNPRETAVVAREGTLDSTAVVLENWPKNSDKSGTNWKLGSWLREPGTPSFDGFCRAAEMSGETVTQVVAQPASGGEIAPRARRRLPERGRSGASVSADEDVQAFNDVVAQAFPTGERVVRIVK